MLTGCQFGTPWIFPDTTHVVAAGSGGSVRLPVSSKDGTAAIVRCGKEPMFKEGTVATLKCNN